MKNISKLFLVVFSLSTLLGVFCNDKITHHRNWNLLPVQDCGEISNASPEGREGQFPWTADLLYNTTGLGPKASKRVFITATAVLGALAAIVGSDLFGAAAASAVGAATGALVTKFGKRRRRDLNLIQEKPCGGVLLNDQHVLTVASCLDGILLERLTAVRLGGRDSGTQDFSIKKVIPHGEFTKEKLEYNIALIVLDQPARISEHIKPICLPRGYGYSEGDTQMIVALTEPEVAHNETYLTHVNIDEIEKCQKEFPMPLHSNEICAINPFGRCSYYTGGPIMKMDGDRYVLMGLDTSTQCNKFRHSVYTNVTYLTEWVLDNLS